MRFIEERDVEGEWESQAFARLFVKGIMEGRCAKMKCFSMVVFHSQCRKYKCFFKKLKIP